MARAYRLGKRAETAAETHRRIMDAARKLLLSEQALSVSMHEIAQAAGVSRATIYQRFGNKQELILAVINDALDRANVQRVRRVLQEQDAGRALRDLIRESTRFWHAEHALFARVKSLAAVDPAFDEVDEQKEDLRQGHIINLVSRLSQQGLLPSGLGQRRARAVLNVLTSFETFDQFYSRNKMSLQTIIAMLTGIAEATLLDQPPPRENAARTAHAS